MFKMRKENHYPIVPGILIAASLMCLKFGFVASAVSADTVNESVTQGESTQSVARQNDSLNSYDGKATNNVVGQNNQRNEAQTSSENSQQNVLSTEKDNDNQSVITNNSWQQDSVGRYYIDASGKRLTGLQTIGGQKYLFDDNGYLKVGEQFYDGSWRLFDQQSGQMEYGMQFLPTSNKWVYYDLTTGSMVHGLQEIDGQYYLFDQGTGARLTGQQYYQGYWYYFNPQNGQRETGQQYLNDDQKTVFYDYTSGQMLYGQQQDQEKWYLFNQVDGSKQYGRQYIADENKWVLYDRSNGAMMYGQQFDQNHWYLFNSTDGSMQYGRQYIADENKWVLYDRNDGTMQYNQQDDQGHWYLFDANTGAMQYGRQYIADENKWVLYDRNDGTMKYNQQNDEDYWYLFDANTGAMQYGRQYIADENKWVLYDRHSGTMLYDEQFDEGNWYFFNDQSGAMTYGFIYIPKDSKWVFANRQDGTYYGGYHYFVDGDSIYFAGWVSEIFKGWQNIYGQSVHFYDDGRLDVSVLHIDFPHWSINQNAEGAPEGCEGASFQMALSIKGKRVASLQEIYNQIGYGDGVSPYVGFNGNPFGYGRSYTTTVLATPLANRLNNAFGVQTKDMTGAGVNDVLISLLSNNPVISYIPWDFQVGPGRDHFHVQLIYGYRDGGFLVADPLQYARGANYWISTGEWNYLNHNLQPVGFGAPASMNVAVI
ncbi:C39 family peptidase [Fructobacillus tropaeoli]|uniref:C39 family peptidase n=1 Tax=Fructobacillus tropaeoli TaxID=709323 RepID=UPI002D979B22|nr:Glucan-binding domain (YG repeat) [Fructobacillus tropaeoli]